MTATYPLVGISTRAAVQSKKNPKEVSHADFAVQPGSVCRILKSPHVSCQSIVQAALEIIKAEGITGLYAGLNSSLIGIGVTNLYVQFYPSLLQVREALTRS